KRNPMGGIPGIVPGKMVCGHKSFCAGDPSMVGGILMKLSSSLGNLKPASLNAFPKSFSLGKSRWQVLHEVPYCRENAGMAWLRVDIKQQSRAVANKEMNTRRGMDVIASLFEFRSRGLPN